jgi:hypothetical protein
LPAFRRRTSSGRAEHLSVPVKAVVSFDRNRSLQRMRFPRRGTGGGFIQFPAARLPQRALPGGTQPPEGDRTPRWSLPLLRSSQGSGQAGRPGGVDSGPGSPSPGRASEASPPGGPKAPSIKRALASARARGALSVVSKARKKKGDRVSPVP